MFGLNGGVPFRNLINNNNQHSSSSIASGFAPLPGNTRTCNGDNVDNSRAALRMDRNCAASNSPPSSIQYRYEAPWNLYAMNWSVRKDQDKKFRLAVGSYQEGPQQGHDTVQIVQLQPDTGLFDQVASFEHNHPANKIAWIPDIHGSYPDLLATSGDYLRIWKLNSATANSGSGPGPGIELALILNNVNSSSTDGRQCLPLTSFDWNQADPSILVTASLDNSCTVWTLDTGQAISQSSKSMSSSVKTQLLAHEKHVYDVAFTHHAQGSRDIFASVGNEGSLRQFDMRNLVQSTILFEDPLHRPLVRLAWNKHQVNHLAFFAENSNQVTILDIRFTAAPLANLNGHVGNVNAINWAPHSADHFVTVGDDQQVLIWDIQQAATRPLDGPILRYKAEGPVSQVQWSQVQPAWISICYNNCLELLRFQ